MLFEKKLILSFISISKYNLMNTSDIEEMRKLSDGPTLLFMLFGAIIFTISMLCNKERVD
jgi:NADH:ubiquinone oxidoreductase subunit H